uniref:Large ribosomal subunit protein mL38 n=1 Tax=Ciona intestinalis TaxID=7719 RepID=F7AES2_CIOIN|nr:39S ribosomal protein L38, mitochondrial-like [Ciona intestinalis]|eukprot:XP_002125755.1 39S ribosomal protein L38, mitochondrial-like [Ciona intestinalis]
MRPNNIIKGFTQVGHVRCLLRHYGSAYRIGTKGKFEVSDGDNKTDEEIYRASVEHAVTSKARSPLYGFEYGTKHGATELPNNKYIGKDLPRYGSYNKYLVEAERTRIRNRKLKLNWKTMDYWWKKHNGFVNFVDIGMGEPPDQVSKNTKMKELQRLKQDDTREQQARRGQLKLNIDEVMNEFEETNECASEIHRVAHHYGVFKDLFGHAHFYPRLRMEVGYKDGGSFINPVHYGNEISPSEASTQPEVTYQSEADGLWSLLLLNLDGNIEDNDKEYLHWFVTNIEGDDITTGETIIDYLQPLPPRGTGYHRMVFLLFKQTNKLNIQPHEHPCPLQDRSFRTRDFYRQHEETIIPMSLRFYQSSWDVSVRGIYHQMDMGEPVYEFVPHDIDRLSPLTKFPEGKTMGWLRRFMPDEVVYPGGGSYT